MAQVALAIGTSHAPGLQGSREHWLERPDPDRQLVEREGLGDWDEMVRSRAGWIEEQILPERILGRHDQCQEAIEQLADVMARVQPDVVIAIGDDHREVFSADHMPAIDVHWGDSMFVLPIGRQARLDWESGKVLESDHTYPGHPGLGLHLIESLVEDGFDVSHTRTLEPGQSLGHTYDFVCRRIFRGSKIPQVPLILNTYFAPNRPTTRRCYGLGKALRRAVDSWKSDLRVCLLASGGLTHTVLDEEMDRRVLEAVRAGDESVFSAYPESTYVNGTSEIKAWVVLAGAMEQDDRDMNLVDYVPLYRSKAGTGCGMAFAYWE